MTPFEKLKSHLVNLQQKNIQKVTLDVNWLIAVLNIMSDPIDDKSTKSIIAHNSVNVDGGSFNDSNQ
jgi:hypothetical protein